LSNAGSFLYQADEYAWSEDPYTLRKPALTVDELAGIRKALEKAAPAPVAKPKPVDLETLKLREEARNLRADSLARLKEAEVKAAQVLAWAEKQAQEKQQAAFQQGLKEGREQGLREGLEQGNKQGEQEALQRWAALMSRWQSILQATLDEKASYLNDRESLMVQLALDTAAKILGHEIHSDRDLALQQARQAIARTIDRSRLLVHLNPQDLDAAKAADIASFHVVDGIKNLEFVADEKVNPGGAYVETDAGSIDARIETQLAELAKSLLEAVHHGE
jgi:flagellar assembly protein FliH